MRTYTAGALPSPQNVEPKLTRPTWIPFLRIAEPESPS
jgi:hypothetical protein